MKYKSEYPYNGLVWEVPMMENLGFAYVQTIDPRPLDSGFPSFIMKILDLRSEQSISKFDVNIFSSIDMLTSHLFFMGKPPQRKGDNKWKAIGYLPITSLDGAIPESKLLSQYDPPFSYYEIPVNSKWRVYFGGSLADYFEEKADFSQVKHLGHLTHFNAAYIHHRITMEWMRKLGLDFSQYYTKEWKKDFLEQQKHEVTTTVLFSEVAPAIRGKAIGNFHKIN